VIQNIKEEYPDYGGVPGMSDLPAPVRDAAVRFLNCLYNVRAAACELCIYTTAKKCERELRTHAAVAPPCATATAAHPTRSSCTLLDPFHATSPPASPSHSPSCRVPLPSLLLLLLRATWDMRRPQNEQLDEASTDTLSTPIAPEPKGAKPRAPRKKKAPEPQHTNDEDGGDGDGGGGGGDGGGGGSDGGGGGGAGGSGGDGGDGGGAATAGAAGSGGDSGAAAEKAAAAEAAVEAEAEAGEAGAEAEEAKPAAKRGRTKKEPAAPAAPVNKGTRSATAAAARGKGRAA
jgi:hypothetical protein